MLPSGRQQSKIHIRNFSIILSNTQSNTSGTGDPATGEHTICTYHLAGSEAAGMNCTLQIIPAGLWISTLLKFLIIKPLNFKIRAGEKFIYLLMFHLASSSLFHIMQRWMIGGYFNFEISHPVLFSRN